MSSQGSGVRRFSGLHGTTHFCLKPDGKTAFILDRAHHTFAQIDLTTGKETLAEIEAPSQLKNPQIWRRLIFLKRAARLYLIALIFDEITKIVYLVSFAEKGSLNFAVVCVYELPNNDKFTANWGVVQEDEKGRIFCVGSRKCPKRDNITIFDTVMVEIDDNGTITSLADNFLAKKQALTGKWSNPFVYSDAMHFLACEYRRRWDGDRINFEHMLNVPLNQKVIRSTVVDLTDNSGCWPAGSSFWSFSPAIIGERAYFYVSQKHHHHSTGALFYLDLKENNWKSWEFLTDDHVLDSYIEIAASEDGRTLCLSGNCALESCVEKAH
uniref:Uncharacterized protein n=1 Tax=Plectus sambesii TaxID=2011161 RepID=A0A914X255_9BILA